MRYCASVAYKEEAEYSCKQNIPESPERQRNRASVNNII